MRSQIWLADLLVGECTRPSRAGASSDRGLSTGRRPGRALSTDRRADRTIRRGDPDTPGMVAPASGRAGGSSAASRSLSLLLAGPPPAAADSTCRGRRLAADRRPGRAARVRPAERRATGPGTAGSTWPPGPVTPVLAGAAGTVAFAGSVAGRGVVSIDHGSVRTTYEPVQPQVAVGQRVAAGQPIGRVAAGGHCGGRCLHWGLRQGDDVSGPAAAWSAAGARTAAAAGRGTSERSRCSRPGSGCRRQPRPGGR